MAAERRHRVAGAGASVGQLISSIYVPHEYRRQIIGPLPEIPRWALSHIRTRPRPTIVRHRGGSSRDPAASELPATEWFIKNGFRLGQRQSRLRPGGLPAMAAPLAERQSLSAPTRSRTSRWTTQSDGV